MIQKQFFRVFQIFALEVKLFIRKTLEGIHKSYSFNENGLKTEIT